MSDETGQLVLNLPKGSLERVTFTLQHDRCTGWSVRCWHRHGGELAMCPYITRYEGLTLTEAIDVLCDTMVSANERYRVLDGHCSPVTGPNPSTG